MNRTDLIADTAAEPRYLSTAQVATALGVSVTTVKRWVDSGVIAAHRTAGGHRKLLQSDVMRAVRGGNLPQADAAALMPLSPRRKTPPGDVAAQFVGAVEAADTATIAAVIAAAFKAGMAVHDLADRVIAPGLSRLGGLWQEGRVDVLHEHAVSQACIGVLYELGAFLEANADAGRPIALGGAIEHDHSTIPSLLARLVLLEAGWHAINLGPHTPLSALRHALDEHRPRLVWLTISHLFEPEAFARDYPAFFAEAEARGVAVALGGRGLTDTLRRTLPYTTFGDGLSHLASFARTLAPQRQRPRRGRPRRNEECGMRNAD